jgi:hypothetical protein
MNKDCTAVVQARLQSETEHVVEMLPLSGIQNNVVDLTSCPFLFQCISKWGLIHCVLCFSRYLYP